LFLEVGASCLKIPGKTFLSPFHISCNFASVQVLKDTQYPTSSSIQQECLGYGYHDMVQMNNSTQNLFTLIAT